MSRVYLSYRVVFHATRYLEQSAVPASCCSSAPFCWSDPMPFRRVFLPVSPMVRVLNLSHSTHGTLWKLSREAKNKKSIQLATFLRLGIVAISPIVDCCPKTRRKWLCRGLLPRCQGGGGLPIARKMQKSRDFCFRDGRITATGRICRKTRKVSNGNEGKCLKRRRGYDDSRANTAKRNKRKRQLGIAAAFCSGCIYANYGQDYRINGKGFAVFK